MNRNYEPTSNRARAVFATLALTITFLIIPLIATFTF